MGKIILTPEQREAINRAIKSYERGNYNTDEEAEKRIQEWLRE